MYSVQGNFMVLFFGFEERRNCRKEGRKKKEGMWAVKRSS